MLSANINNKLRKEVYRREGFMCALCGDNRSLQIHHYLHRSEGGGNTPHNLIALCWRCHALTHGKNYFEDPDHQTLTAEDAEQAIVEYLADMYPGEWNPWRKEG